LTSPTLLLAGIGVGLSSSVIPYVCDQLAMARLPRATFALVLRQVPTLVDLLRIALVGVGVGLHKPPD
jgi:inner membrane transporter RhtA